MSTAVYVVYATRTLALDWLPDDAQVVVVHNDDQLDRTSLSRPVVHVGAGRNVGFGAGVNLALPHVTGPRLVLCNPDLVVSRVHWDALIDAGDGDVVTVPLRDEAGTLTSVCSAYPTPLSQLATGYRVGRWFPRGARTRGWASRMLGSWGRTHGDSLVDPVGAWPLSERWVSGAALSVDVDRLRAIGGFDESYFLYSEDIDLSRRLAGRHPGMRAVVADVTPGTHAVGASAAGNTPFVERARLDAAIRYAEAQSGRRWGACAWALRQRRRWVR